jgi:multiple antibiotic resistance protein
MDPLGNVPLFLSLLKQYSPREQKKIIIRELFFALAIIIFFYFLGSLLLDAIKVQEHTVLISGGIILFLIAIRMIFPEHHSQKEEQAQFPKEPFIVPLAVPFIAGPAVLATVMLYSKQPVSCLIIVCSIVIAWIFSAAILIFSSSLQKFLGEKGLIACERLMGLLITLLAVQMFLQGLSLYFLNDHSAPFAQ